MARAQPTCLGDPNVPTNLTRHSERLAKVLNGNVSYGATMVNGQDDINTNTWKLEGNSGVAANTPFTLKHSLGDGNGKTRVPICIVGQVTTDGGVIYADVSTWTKTTVTLKSTTANTPFRLIIA